MKITIFFFMVLVCVIQTTERAAAENVNSTTEKAVKKKENPIDTLLFMANSLLRGDLIATLTRIVEVVQRQDTGLILEVVLILVHRFLTLLQPIFYILFPSTKDQGGVTQNFKSRIETMSHLMGMLMA